MAVPLPHADDPEYQVLIASSRALTGDEGARPGQSLTASINWGRVMELAEWHRLEPLLFVHLRAPELQAGVPSEMMRSLHAAYYTTAARAALYETELASIVDVLHHHEIPVMLLKGSALIRNVYQDSGLRSMNDLDLLVPHEMIESAEKALIDQGWGPLPEQGPKLEMRRSFRHLPPLSNRAGTVSVEIHRELVSPPLLWDINRVWERSSPSEHWYPAVIPSPEDLLAHVSLHFFMDRHELRSGALRQLTDIAQIVRTHPSLDWDLLRAEAARTGTVGAVACGFWAAHQLLAVPVPEWVIDEVSYDAEGAETFVRQRVLGHDPWPLRGLVPADEDYAPARVARHILKRLFPSRHYLERRYSKGSQLPVVWLAKHWRDVMLRWGGSVLHPASARQGLVADRWLHSLVTRGETDPPSR